MLTLNACIPFYCVLAPASQRVFDDRLPSVTSLTIRIQSSVEQHKCCCDTVVNGSRNVSLINRYNMAALYASSFKLV